MVWCRMPDLCWFCASGKQPISPSASRQTSTDISKAKSTNDSRMASWVFNACHAALASVSAVTCIWPLPSYPCSVVFKMALPSSSDRAATSVSAEVIAQNFGVAIPTERARCFSLSLFCAICNALCPGEAGTWPARKRMVEAGTFSNSDVTASIWLANSARAVSSS